MGTSSAFGGQSGGTPLVPSWLVDAGATPVGSDGAPPQGAAPAAPSTSSGTDDRAPHISPQPSIAHPPIPPAGDPARFSSARSNFTRFARSGGGDRRSLGRAISQYVGSSAGGSRNAAARMGSARHASGRLLSFLSTAVSRGASEALRALNLSALAGRPIEEIFLALADYVVPDGGSIDEGIAREAFIETIADLAESGVMQLDGLTEDQMLTVFEIYAANAIEARLCNDIGMKTITMPSDIRDAARVQAQLKDFIRRGVADALSTARPSVSGLTPDTALQLVGSIYEQAFEVLRIAVSDVADAP